MLIALGTPPHQMTARFRENLANIAEISWSCCQERHGREQRIFPMISHRLDAGSIAWGCETVGDQAAGIRYLRV